MKKHIDMIFKFSKSDYIRKNLFIVSVLTFFFLIIQTTFTLFNKFKLYEASLQLLFFYIIPIIFIIVKIKKYEENYKLKTIFKIFFVFSIFILFDFFLLGIQNILFSEINIYLFISAIIFLIFFTFLLKITLTFVFFEKEKIKESLNIIFKGFLIGFVDIIPGLSGGTLAFVLGIYTRLIKAISKVTIKNMVFLFFATITLNYKKSYNILKKNDIFFALILFIGILTTTILTAKIFTELFKYFELYLISFFIGVIIFSSLSIYKKLTKHNNLNIIFFIIGFFIMIGLIFLPISTNSNISNWNLFFSGFAAISAMIIPGISGSQILLIMGSYKEILFYWANLTTYYEKLVPFYIGILAGFFLVSRIMNFLLKYYYFKTMYFIFGMIIGSAFYLFFKFVIPNLNGDIFQLINVFLLFIFGSFIAIIFNKYSKT